ncbi:4Fe-4S dicluster domain-containing protein [Candidatus Bathyarchaeota archaeon]|nr:4Fe-4S dicluster domain-containing protein [Candidatus Bathyarchaeota archaeon]
MFPRLDHKITSDKQFAEKRFLVRSARLELDKDNCRNCGVCLNACPNDVITRGAPGASIKTTGDQVMAGVLLDPDSCSYCGVCSYLCPFDALTLFIDGEPVKDEKLQLVIKGALPELDAKEVQLLDGKKGKHFMDGHLEYDEDKCQSGCRTCTNLCPTGALSFEKRDPWQVGEKFVIDRDACIYCGACAFSCPSSAIKIFRDKIMIKGEFSDPFWPDIEKRLLIFHGTFE